MPGEEELIRLRHEKLQRLRTRGVDAYPARVDRSHTAAEAIAAYEAWASAGSSGEPPVVSVAGRVTASRDMGKSSFIDLTDGSGRLQCFVRQNIVGEEAYGGLADIDLGDFLAVSGPLMKTRAGETSVEARSIGVIVKALRPPPEKWHGVEDVEIRYRQRYLDLMSNAEVREIFRTRAAVVAGIRRYLDSRGFIEVETPVLQAEAGGAAAMPFTTHHRALDQDFFLRISLELHLKRLIIGGYDKVYEIGRIFRNEGVSWKYNPEFTMLESYEAYADYNDVARMVEDMVSSIARDVLGTTSVQYGDHTLELAPPWGRVTMRDALIEHAGIDFEEFRTRDKLREELQRRGFQIDPGWSWAKLLDEAVSHYVEPKLVQPTFLLDYPIEISPLAKRKPDAPGLVERFEVFCAGYEIGNAYSELNDPIDQRERFETQRRIAAAGLEEVETLDEDFLIALEHGMPPTGGLGIGIDRLVMLLTGKTSIREVILFPLLRRRE
jgi:lysyl-tRNA synthetase, class II